LKFFKMSQTDEKSVIMTTSQEVVASSIISSEMAINSSCCDSLNNFVTFIRNPVIDTDKESTFKITFLLSLFDNIVGPKTVHHWTHKLNELNENNHYLLRYISLHTLNGELYNQEKLVTSSYKYRFYFIKEIECAIMSIFFDASTINVTTFGSSSFGNLLKGKKKANKNENEKHHNTTLNCFSIIVPYEHRQFLLDKSSLLMSAFSNFILEYKVYAEIKEKINNVTTAISHLSGCIEKLCSDLYTLDTKGIKKINIKDTYLSTSDSSIDREFLTTALTSHFITNMNSIVIGKSSALINRMIATLAYFMAKENLTNSCYSLPDNEGLSSYFNVQGCINENPSDLNSIFDAEFLLNKTSPTTIIDLSSCHVYRTPILDDFTFIKERFNELKVQRYFDGLSKEDLLVDWPLSSIIQSYNTSKSTLVSDMLKHIDSLEMQFGVRDSYLSLFQKDLYLAALNLIDYINNKVIKIEMHREKLHSVSVKRILKEMDYKCEEDLYVIISFANNLKLDSSISYSLR